METWIDLWTKPQTEKPIDQLTDTERSMIAIHNGGILGEGAGQSAMRIEMIHPESDYAYAFFVEEYGIVLALLLLLLYLWIFFRAIEIFRRCGHGISGSAGPGIGPVDYLPGAAAHHGNGKPDSRNGTNPAAHLTRRLLDDLHGYRPGHDLERQPTERRTIARHAQIGKHL